MNNINMLFSPKSVAVIGASSKPGKVGHDIFANILSGKYTGTLYPINPKARSICSIKSYNNILDIKDQIDLALIVLPPISADRAVRESIEKGVKAIVIVSAGFREIGGKGADIEKNIANICKKNGISLAGPNCLGVINPIKDISLNASFSIRMPSAGNVSFISQSGALCSAVLDFAAYRDFGFSKFISIGNKAGINELDLLKYLHSDPDTDVILLYLEELQYSSNFIETVAQITGGENPTPILAIKSGRTAAGAAAAISHTGSLTGSEEIYEAIFAQSGIIRVNSIDELFNFGIAFAYKNKSAIGKLKRKVPHGNKIAIVTNAGGPGIVATDTTIYSGLKLAKFSKETIEVLKSHLPITANIDNPVDIIGDAAQERYHNALSAVIKDNNVNGVLVILTPQSMTDSVGTAKVIVKLASKSYKPIICCFMGVIDVSNGVNYLQNHGIPVYPFPETATKTLGALYKYSLWLNRQEFAPFNFKYETKTALKIIKNEIDNNKKYIKESVGLKILECYGFNVLKSTLVTNKEHAVKEAKKIGFPIVLKIVSSNISHKTDAGGVILDIKNEIELLKSYETIIKNVTNYNSRIKIDGILIQKMAPKGQEVILGISKNSTFGSLIMYGTGGIFVEIFQDVRFRLAPLNREDARYMIRNTKGYKILNGFRGNSLYDIDSVEKMLIKLSDLTMNHPEISELDINPLIVHKNTLGTTVADCRIILNLKKTFK